MLYNIIDMDGLIKWIKIATNLYIVDKRYVKDFQNALGVKL